MASANPTPAPTPAPALTPIDDMSVVEMLADLGVDTAAKPAAAGTAEEERIIAGFEEIRRFVERHGRLPSPAAGNDIFERIYATRLAQLRRRPECRAALAGLDHQGLLDDAAADAAEAEAAPEGMSNAALLAELDPSAPAGAVGADDVTRLRHVKSQAEKRIAEEIANRTLCKDFDAFRPLFDAVQQQLESGARETRKFRKHAGFLKADIRKGQFFILGGQVAYIAKVGAFFAAPNGDTDARLRVIYANGVESDLLLRSMQRALYKDEGSRVVSDPGAGPLFSTDADADAGEEDSASGVIYVLRSKSDLPQVSENREVLHKIGVTGGNVEKRIANAAHDATFLLADVEIVARYELFNINRQRLEKLIHRFFAAARLDIEIKDRFGQPVTPREWFLVPLFAIDQAVEKIRDGSIGDYTYNIKTATLTPRG